MASRIKAWIIALFLCEAFGIVFITTEAKDNCVKALNSLKTTMLAKFRKLEADVKAISRSCGPNSPGSSYTSCRDIHLNRKSRGNKAYMLQTDIGKIPVYCHMTSYGIGGCGGGGWTLVMKINGHKRTFHYDSHFWKNKADFNRPGGRSGFNTRQTKLPTYWSTPFSKICLAMKIGYRMRSFVINRRANSLHSLIADGKYRATSVGRNTWKSLIGWRGSLQYHCNRQGFNVRSDLGSAWPKARIGILANNEHDCRTCDSRIGFGTGGKHDDSNTCGNEAIYRTDRGNRHIKTMGYILVQ